MTYQNEAIERALPAMSRHVLATSCESILGLPADHPLQAERKKSPFPLRPMAGAHEGTGTAWVTSVFIWTHLGVDLSFGRRFDADIWGAAFIAHSAFTGNVSFLLSPEELKDLDCDVHVAFAPGVLTIGWWLSGNPIGAAVMAGGGPNLAGVAGGRGRFR